uniref:NADH-ubiquinone oxidoreductase chain 4 n=1 Tax=Cichlidarus nyanzae TaxID=608002 RepID=A0A2Z4GPJ6_9PLAT|nr:NADH dehydrogenase subunit 4 [Gyrodactylus nyanzae]AWW03126.1 NADH dehydrogenase subunit 4 [Gyrodactylus nyanzae]
MILWQILPISFLFILLNLLFPLISSIELNLINFSINDFSLVLCIIPLIILFSLYLFIISELNYLNLLLIVISSISGILCFITTNIIYFFILYELSIICLLFSLFIGSPYSERSMAGWYFLGYLTIGGIPLLILCLYLSLTIDNLSYFNLTSSINYILFIIFITKVPLFPFHSWLPIVHAEANSYVSIMLSGYIMKLGLIGIYRYFYISGEYLKLYILIFFAFSVLFFFSSICEIDNKRWLAFLSLGHISIGILGLFSLDIGSDSIVSIFGYGHGLSVFILFYFFYIISNNLGSRNWLLILHNNNNIINLILVICLLSLISFPPSVLFFCELILFNSSIVVLSILFIFSLYIFFSLLPPILNIGLLISRRLNTFSSNFYYNSIFLLFSILYLYFFGILYI